MAAVWTLWPFWAEAVGVREEGEGGRPGDGAVGRVAGSCMELVFTSIVSVL